ncbi:MFS transporter [Bifidobacterium sp.]|jgi:MFS family permease|uniref:MFS transporter n=1 Tax=Bifidobacterium sp. TaxID=41200 RepID=UPI0025BA3240|nr:MFS transporter [Bifidobacterium sp.]MCI1635415.1 MFS transporter [Bifidobacterium sp.]
MSKRAHLWRSQGYLAWFTADTAVAVGSTLRGFAIPLIAFSVSQSLATAGWISTLSLALQQICELFGGTIVDRHLRKPMIIGNAVMQMVLWSVVTVLMVSGRLTMFILFGIVALSACTTGLIGQATDAALRSIISMQDYSKARSINEGRDATINMAGSPIGGILYGIQPWLPFLCSAIVYAIAGGSALRLHMHEHLHAPEESEQSIVNDAAAEAQNIIHHSTEQASARQPSFLSDFLQGWKWSFHTRRIPLIIAAASLINFGLSGIQYTVQLHLINISTQPFRIGLMDTGVCIGMLIGSIVANRLSDNIHVGKAMVVAFSMSVLCVLPMLFNHSYWVIFIFYALLASPFPIVNSMLFGFVFSKTDETLQGRVATVISAPAQMLSMWCSGIAGMLLPAVGFTVTAGFFLIALVVSALIATFSSAINDIPRSSEWSKAEL